MKVLVLIVLLAVVLIAGYLFISKNNPALLSGLGVNSGANITLVKESGGISYKATESDQYTQLTDDQVTIKNGSFIKTDADSYARVFLPDNSLVSIDESTEIQINYQDNNTDIQQLIGKTWNRVQTLSNGGEYKVETPNTVAAVRGTIFGVGVDDDNHSRVFSIEHTVSVGKHNKGDNTVTGSQDVSDGQIANVNNDSGQLDIKLGATPDSITNTFWYKRNQVVDEEWLKIKDMKGVNLVDLLNENLMKRSDYNDLRLGLPAVQTDPTKIQDQLANAYKFTTITQSTCSEATPASLQVAIDEVQRYRTYVANADAIINLLTELKKDCADGKLDASEIQVLQGLVNQANGQ